jgi:UDP-glucose 4-epimerase
VLRPTDTICHVAAHIPANYRSPESAEACAVLNALGTLETLRAAQDAGARRFVHFSSGNIYSPGSDFVDENAPTYPAARASYYLASKLCGEIYVEHARLTQQLDTTVLRVASVYGPGMVSRGLLPTFAARLISGQSISVNDGGRYQVDLVHVEDVVEAALLAALADTNGIFNVGSGERSTTLDVARAMVHALELSEDKIVVEPPSGPTDLGFSTLNVDRAKHYLGFSPRNLDAGIRDYLRWLTTR